MKRLNSKNKEQGFTIIELVVVILLLGILTATALPRFIDVTDEAHSAVVDAVEGGLGTGIALFRAQWFAANQPATITQYEGLYANSTGWPKGLDKTLTSMTDCVNVFQSLLQAAGRPTIVTLTSTGADFASLAKTTTMTTKLAGMDYGAHYAGTGKCDYVYTGQYKNNVDGSLPVLKYDSASGKLTRTKK